MTPDGTVTILHSFTGAPNDGAIPRSGLIQADDGNFYGTTTRHANNIFQISISGDYIVFQTLASPSGAPFAGLIQDVTNLNFYGTTGSVLLSNEGTVFQMSVAGTVTVLHQFTGSDGADPRSALILATDGKLYGTTSRGGTPPNSNGVVFRIGL